MTLSLAIGGCGLGGNFSDGLDLERCEDTFPVCQTSAGCVLTENEYLEGRFPGQKQVIVSAPTESVIHVEVFFLEQTASGLDTEIRWNEPGCFETYRWTNDGRDVFQLAGSSRVLSQSRQVFEDGDHLIEVFSDAVADYQMKIRIDAPDN